MGSSEWIEATLGDVVELLTGYPFKSQLYTDDPNGIPLVRGDNVVQGALRWEGVKRWPAELIEGLDQYRLAEGDVVLAMDRPWIEAGLKYAIVSRQYLPALLVQRVSRLRGVGRMDTKFLPYVIGSTSFTNHVLAVQTGTAVPHISAKQILSYRFLLPSLPEQRAIAAVLGALDDKIELNRRMNGTLEAMARALFKSWFVDFDPVRAKMDGRPSGLPAEIEALFPGEMETGEDGVERPRGWAVKPLDEIATYLNGLALQKYPATGADFLPVIKIAQLRKGNTDGADRASPDVPSDYIIDDGDILFSWSGSLEVVIWYGGRGALNQHLFKVASNDFPKWYYYLWTKEHLADFQEIAAGKATTMGHIQRKHLTQAKAFVPSRELIEAMDNHMSPIIDRIVTCSVESRTLAALRDALLPKLMSGEVRVGQVET